MIWQLFSVHISLSMLVLILFLLWLLWPRRNPKLRKLFIRGAGLLLLGSLLLASYTYWPRSFEKNYVQESQEVESSALSLRAMADSLDFNIGIASSHNPAYPELISKEFNSLVAENDFKPGQLLVDANNWEFDFTKADILILFADTHDMRLRGHTLIWGKFPGMTFPAEWQEEIKAAQDKEAKMKALMRQYIERVMQHFKGRVRDWDVVNEPMGGDPLFPSIFTESMGESYIDYAFQLAREFDPDATLYLNEQIPDYESEQGKAFLDLLQRLLDRGVPIDGVGLQCHNLNNIHDTVALRNYIRKIAEMGLEVEITELDIRLLLFKDSEDPYQAQGDQFRKIAEICLDDPACKGLTLWGLTDGANWMDAVPPFMWKSPNAPNIFDEDMNKKPAYWGLHAALKRKREMKGKLP